jgi:hypothetical protein
MSFKLERRMFLLNFVDFQPIVTQEDGDDTGLARSAHFHD